MIKHIVLFKLRDDVNAKTKASFLSQVREELLALQGQVASLRSIEIGLNINPNEHYDLALTATFDDMEGLEAYATDPKHLAVGKKLRELLDARSCTDYEM